MSYELLITPEAAKDVEEIILFLDDGESGPATRFLKVLQVRFRHIKQYPELSTLFLRDEIRRLFMVTFPYHLYFRVVGMQVRVLAVIHTSRDPHYISNRLKNEP